MGSLFRYKARDKFGAAVSGVMAAENSVAVAMKLKLDGCTPFAIDEETRSPVMSFFSRFRRIKSADLNAFTREFYTLTQAGLTVLAALEVIGGQDRDPLLRGVVEGMLTSIRGGSSISESLARYPKVFSPLYVNMFKAGEASGRLEQVLERLLYIGEAEEKLQMRVKSALRYPLIVLCAISAAFLFLSNFIIPRFAQLFASRNVELPLPTRILLGINYAMTHYGWLVAVGLLLAGYGFFRAKRTPWGRMRFDQLLLKLPVFGPLILMADMSRFSRIMALLVQSGIPVVKALEIAYGSADNRVVADAIETIRKSVIGGSSMEQPMRASGIFPSSVIRMVKVGEETGKIDELLLKVSEYYDMRVDYLVSNLMVLIEPMLIVVLGSMILVMALGMFLPMWNLIRVFRA